MLVRWDIFFVVEDVGYGLQIFSVCSLVISFGERMLLLMHDSICSCQPQLFFAGMRKDSPFVPSCMEYVQIMDPSRPFAHSCNTGSGQIHVQKHRHRKHMSARLNK